MIAKPIVILLKLRKLMTYELDHTNRKILENYEIERKQMTKHKQKLILCLFFCITVASFARWKCLIQKDHLLKVTSIGAVFENATEKYNIIVTRFHILKEILLRRRSKIQKII